uniref:H(+)-transporting two-sector ATPase n=1 Tax=Halophila decipiens TaxID=55459 RepID=A0A1B2ARJ6_9LILI|nr:ATPase subunit 8 [Halophila decipiens]
MPQLDQFTYFTQFFWSCLAFFTYYISLCNDREGGILGIGLILKLRNQLLSHRGNKIRSIPQTDPLEEVLIKGLSTGVSYLSETVFEVSQWAVHFLGKKRKITVNSSFVSGSRVTDRLYGISKYDGGSRHIMLIHAPHGQGRPRTH